MTSTLTLKVLYLEIRSNPIDFFVKPAAKPCMIKPPRQNQSKPSQTDLQFMGLKKLHYFQVRFG